MVVSLEQTVCWMYVFRYMHLYIRRAFIRNSERVDNLEVLSAQYSVLTHSLTCAETCRLASSVSWREARVVEQPEEGKILDNYCQPTMAFTHLN